MLKDKGTIKRDYEKACNNYLNQLFIDWGLVDNDDDGTRNFGWWVGDEVGGVYCLEDDTFLNMDEIRYCVDNNVSRETYEDYQDYNSTCLHYGFDTLNLKSFVSGAPRIPQESFDNIRECEQTLFDAIDTIKKRLKKEG